MTRRAQRGEIGFGSDSFLDIVANLVGILIILIVIAGLRAGQLPQQPTNEPLTLADEPAALELADEPLPLVPEPEPGPEPLQPSPELIRQARSLEDEVAGLERASAERAAEFKAAADRYRALQQQIAEAQKAVAESETGLESHEKSLAELQSDLDKNRLRLKQLHAELAKAQSEAPPVKAIRHKVTPIGRHVEGRELHFRLAEGKVAYVPLEELLNRLKPQINRQKERLIKTHRHEGEVGPVDGFTMQYVVERQHLGVLEEMRHGQGMVRISVTEWQILPDRGLEAESAEQALESGSRFQRALRIADPGVNLTFWVYPDSYGLYRQLQEFAHESGFTVAARPLPEGVPIAGSPRGTKSSGQ